MSLDLIQAYQLAVQEVLLDHNYVDRLWVLESEEAEASRAASGTIAHHLAVDDLSELREVVLE